MTAASAQRPRADAYRKGAGADPVAHLSESPACTQRRLSQPTPRSEDELDDRREADDDDHRAQPEIGQPTPDPGAGANLPGVLQFAPDGSGAPGSMFFTTTDGPPPAAGRDVARVTVFGVTGLAYVFQGF